jgi:site-specific DNA recombinase
MPRKRTRTDPTPQVAAMRAAIYVRVSTEDQAQSGYGLDVQRSRCRAMAEVKDWRIVSEYSDEGISGTKDASGRPGLSALLGAAQAGQIDAVIILALDRLGRKTRIVLDLVEILTAAGVQLVSCKESLDTSTPQGQFVLTMFAAIAQLERETIMQRTSAGRDERAAVDGEQGGRLPYGYTRSGQGIQIDNQASGHVRLIYQARQHASLRAIASELNRIVLSPRGGRWHASSIAEILKNEDAYRGGRRGESTICWPAIL